MSLKKQYCFRLTPLMLLLGFLLTACGGQDPTTAEGSFTPLVTVKIVNPVSTTAASQPPVSSTPDAAQTTAVPTTSTNAAKYPGKIAFSTAEIEVFTINPDGTGRTKVTAGQSPLFSPDGKRLAYLSGYQASKPDIKLSTVNLDGTDKQDSCNFDVGGLLRWSPKGRFVAARAGQNLPGALVTCAIAEKSRFPEMSMTQGKVSLVYDWTPGGDFALWQSPSGVSEFNLYYGDPDQAGKGAVALTKSQNRFVQGDLKLYNAARFSPDGKSVAIAGSKLFFVSAPGQKSSLEDKVFDSMGPDTRLAWSPDGKALAISDLKTVKLLDLSTGQLTLLSDNARLGDWSRQ